MISRFFSLRSLALIAFVAAGSALSSGTAEAGGHHPRTRVVYVPAKTVYVYPAPVVRTVVVVHPAPVHRPSCH